MAVKAKNHPSARSLGYTGLRILMIAPQPFFRARGTPFSVLHRIRALVGAGHWVDLVTYPFGEDIQLPRLRMLRSPKPAWIKDVKIGPSLNKLILDVPLYFTALKALRSTPYDVLHSHEEAAFFSVGLARRLGLIHVYDMHSSLPQQLRNFRSYNLPLIRRTFEWLENWVLNNCDGVITICPELAERAIPKCGSKPHAMIENTADDTKVFGNTAEDPHEAFGLCGKKVILYTGTFEAYQGLDLLVDAFARMQASHPSCHLLMVGGRSEQIEKYRTKIEALGLTDTVTFVGSVYPSRIPAFLRIADLIVSPRSSGTNTPLKIYGYMRSGRPLVATNLLTHTQCLDAETALLVPPTEAGLAEGMTKILDDPMLGRRLAEAAAARARIEFSDDDYLRKVTAFYEQVLDASGHRASRVAARI